MKLYLDELLTDVDVSQIQITEKHPLSLELIVEHTLAACQDAAPARGKKRLPVALVAAIVVGLLATTALAVTTSVYHLKTVSLEYPVSEQGEILPPEDPDLGITLSLSDISPTGLCLTAAVEPRENIEGISAYNGYALEVQRSDGWAFVPTAHEHPWHWEDAPTDAECWSWQIDWKTIYGSLAPGRYKIDKAFCITFADGTSELYFISEGFVIGGDSRQ